MGVLSLLMCSFLALLFYMITIMYPEHMEPCPGASLLMKLSTLEL